MKGKKAIFIAMLTAVAAITIFSVRRGWERPFFAVTDALSIGGFVGLLTALVPRAAASGSFDGFSYALSCAAAGLFPGSVKSYSVFKSEREKRRGGQAERGLEWLTPLIFFSFGMIFSLFFL